MRFLDPRVPRHLAGSLALAPALREIAPNWPRWLLRQLLLPVWRLPMVVETRAGTRFHLDGDRVDDAIVRHLYHSDPALYFPPDVTVPGGALILDVGAHHGIYAVEALRRHPGARLIAVEPNPAGRQKLAANLALNGLAGRVEIVAAALGARAGRAFLEFSAEGSWGDRTIAAPSGQGVAVPVVGVAEVLAGRTPAVVKLNAEGAEFEVLPALFAEGIFPPFLVLMTHPEAGSVPELLALVRAAGYDVSDARQPPSGAYFHCRLRSGPI